MRVAVDVRPLALSQAGIGRYVEGLLGALGKISGLEIVPLAIPRWLGPFWSPRAERWWEEVWAPRRVARAGCDVVHGTRYWVPEMDGVATVVTVHDLTFETVPDAYTPEARAYFSGRVKRVVAGAARIAVGAESVKRELVAWSGVAGDRVAVVPHGTPEGFSPGEGRHEGRPYILAVGTIEPRKNYAALVSALALMRQRQAGVRLILAGRRDRGWPAVEDSARRLRLEDAVTVVEKPTDGDLLRLYRGASLLAIPSLDEGFGFPVLEAMACGIPVVASNRGSLPEVVGTAGLLVSPSPEPLADACVSILEDAALARRLRAAGIRRAAEFTWARAAEQLAAMYREVAA